MAGIGLILIIRFVGIQLEFLERILICFDVVTFSLFFSYIGLVNPRPAIYLVNFSSILGLLSSVYFALRARSVFIHSSLYEVDRFVIGQG